MLRALSLNAGRVSTHGSLLRQVWSGRGNGDPKIVRAYVKRLRRKLGDDAGDPVYILNERGVGYRMRSRVNRSGLRIRAAAALRCQPGACR